MRLRFSDTEWLVPLAGISAGLMVTDRDVSLHLSHDPKTISHYNTISNAGIGALVGGAAGLWLLSYPVPQRHWRETGLLAGQAALNSLVAVEALKYSLGRERPFRETARALLSRRNVVPVRARRRGMGSGRRDRARISGPAAEIAGLWPGFGGQLLAHPVRATLSCRCLCRQHRGQPDRPAGLQPSS